MNTVYEKGKFIVKEFNSGRRREYIIINERKEEILGYKNAHTHLKSFNKCKEIIDLVDSGKIKTSLSPYLLTSLERLSEDDIYRRKVRELIAVKRDRGREVYRNRPAVLI